MREPNASAHIVDLPEAAAGVLARVRAKAPRVHCLTNAVAQSFTANILLAAGAIPSMTVSVEEIGAFVGRANALLINLGTFDAARRAAAEIAVEQANAHEIPWVLDPVFIDRSAPRAALAREFAAKSPAALRLNAAEFAALTQDVSDDARVSAWAGCGGAVVALTGATDFVTDGTRRIGFRNGHPLMAQVTAMGDALSALVAAFLAVESDPWRAAACAVLAFGVAGEIAAEQARGPGSFAVAVIDAVHALDRAALTDRAKLVQEASA